MDAIRATDLTKVYGYITALDELSLTVEDGELFGLLGPNGAGKTTTIDTITGVIEPDSGDIEVLGLDPRTQTLELKHRVGVLPEKESPPSSHTPREYFLDFIAEARDLDKERVEADVEKWAERLDFKGKLDSLNSRLSRGQQQKVMLVGAFITQPDLLVIDEPLANLDPLIQVEVKEAIKEFNDSGMTVLLSTHQVHIAEELCDKVCIVKNGKNFDTVDPDTLDVSLEEYFIETVGDE